MKVIILFGPTAVGKTELISRLFSKNYEIINADSMQVYRTLDIGTAKPGKELLNKIPHHLIDINLPEVQFNAGDFVRLADKTAVEIENRGSVPVICGGTAFYLKNYLFGLPEIPEIKKDIRIETEDDLAQKGLEHLYSELCRLDPVRAAQIHPNDQYRILRAIEIIRSTGEPASVFSTQSLFREGIDPLIIGLRRERTDLYSRIDRRVDDMFDSGLLTEIKECFKSGYNESFPGMRGIGYREFFTPESYGEFTLPDIRDQIKMNSRRYAKRQITFFKALPGVSWFHPDEADEIEILIKSFLDSPGK